MGPWSEEEILRFRGLKLYSQEPDVEPTISSCRAFITVAHKVKSMGWTMSEEVATWFVIAIEGRRELREWHNRLPADDERTKTNDQHEAFLETLVSMAKILIETVREEQMAEGSEL